MNRKTKIKKIYIIITIFIIIIIILIRYNTNNYNKNKDISFAAKQYLTTGFFNSYKLFNVDNSYITFSDSNEAILNVKGMETKTPHATVYYKLKMSKDSRGVWHVKKVDSLSDIEYMNESN